jgi:hypothetical protein
MNDKMNTGFSAFGILTRKMLVDDAANRAFRQLCCEEAVTFEPPVDLPAPPHVARVRPARPRWSRAA